MTIFWHPTGPRLRYENGMLYSDSLNPENHIHWRISRWEMVKTGVRFIAAALKRE
jgi:hypothetical protein